jgi:hypothetical protein
MRILKLIQVLALIGFMLILLIDVFNLIIMSGLYKIIQFLFSVVFFITSYLLNKEK